MNEIHRRHQHARRAEPALQRVVFREKLLQRMHLAALRQAFDRADLGTVGLDGEHQAGAHGLAVDHHRTGAAHAVLAADMGAGQAQTVAQEIGQQGAGFCAAGVGAAVDGKGNGAEIGHDGAFAFSTACNRARRVMAAVRRRR